MRMRRGYKSHQHSVNYAVKFLPRCPSYSAEWWGGGVFGDIAAAPRSGRGRVGGVPGGAGGRPRRRSRREDQTRASVSRFSSDGFKRKTRQRRLFLCENRTILESCCAKRGGGWGDFSHGLIFFFSPHPQCKKTPKKRVVSIEFGDKWGFAFSIECVYDEGNVTRRPLGRAKYRTLSEMINLTDPLCQFLFFVQRWKIPLHKPDSPVGGGSAVRAVP